MTAKIIC